MRIYAWIVVVGIVCPGCSKPVASGRPPQFTVTPVDTLPRMNLPDTLVQYLALGDSYTIGQSVAPSERFPAQAAVLFQRQRRRVVPPEIIATTGWTTGNLLARMNAQPPLREQYDLVTLLIGVNNQYQRRTQDEYRDQFTQLLQHSIRLAGGKPGKVIVLSIPDYSVTPFAAGSNTTLIAAQIDSFNYINRQVTALYSARYLDITPATRQATVYPSLIAADGLHPSGQAYRQWAEMLQPFMEAAVRD